MGLDAIDFSFLNVKFSASCFTFPLSLSSRGSLVPLHSPDQFSSVAQLCPTLCDPMNRSMPGLPVHHQLPEFTQTHVHWVGDAIQPSHLLSSPSPPAPNPSQHQGLFQWVNSSVRVILSAYLRLLKFLSSILIPACDLSSPEFWMVYSAYKLNKQGDSIFECYLASTWISLIA